MNAFRRVVVTGGAFALCLIAMFVVLGGVSQAHTTISVQPIDIDGGVTPAYSDTVAVGMQFANTGREFVHIKNTNAATYTVAITSTWTENGLELADVSLTLVPTSGDIMAGPFPTKLFNNSSGYVEVGFSGITDLKIAAIRLP